jgi:Fe-S oxidoreductase
MRRTHRVLDVGLPIVALEPSCASALRTDLPELLGVPPLPVQTFAQVLEASDWQPPFVDRQVTGQLHCHQHATFGDAADRRLRAKAGLVGDLAGGCCGLAGNFGFEAGHREVSLKVAEDRLLPELAAHPDAVVLADGFSCRTQIADLTGRRAVHLAELLVPQDRTRRFSTPS